MGNGRRTQTLVERDRSLIEDYEKGMTQVACATAYGITQQQVHRILKREGAKIRHGGWSRKPLPQKRSRY